MVRGGSVWGGGDWVEGGVRLLDVLTSHLVRLRLAENDRGYWCLGWCRGTSN